MGSSNWCIFRYWKRIIQSTCIQGLSVVLVALADNDKTPPHMSLNTILDELKSTYKGQEFRKIEASFNYGVDYMPAIID